MRSFRSALSATVALGLLAGCFGSNLTTLNAAAPAETQANHLVNGRFIPGRSKFASLIPVELQHTPAAVLDRIEPDKHHHKKGVVGIYGSMFYKSFINGYKGSDPKNGPPLCTLGGSYVNDIAVDGKGNLIVPDGGTLSVIVYKPECGPKLGTIGSTYTYGQPSDAASFDAATGTIVVGDISSVSVGGAIDVCTLKSGCIQLYQTDYTNMWELAGVAFAKNGDCWGSATDVAGVATMNYFKHCSGGGQVATGWKNTYYGGLDIDTQGNIVAVDAFVPQLWVYRGCNPACHVVAGPFPLHGATVFGHLNRAGTRWIGGDYENGMLDVYKYSTKALTYEYSISNGLNVSDEVEGAAFSPSSKK